MHSRSEQSPRTTKQPDVDDPNATGIFIATGQHEGLRAVSTADLTRARAEVQEDTVEETGFFRVGEGGRGLQRVSAAELRSQNLDMISLEADFPEIKGFNPTTGILYFQNEPEMEMNHLPGFPPCEVKILSTNDHGVELQIKYSDNYSLTLRRRTAAGEKKESKPGFIEMSANTGKGSRVMKNELGGNFDLRSGIEEFKIRAYEQFITDTEKYKPADVEEIPNVPYKEPAPKKSTAPGPLDRLRKWLGV